MKNITPLEAFENLKEDKGATLIDVRTYGEVTEESIVNAKHIPLDELPSRLNELAGFSSLMFLCRSGGRSASAAAIAEGAGLPGVMNVLGGIMGWMGAGLPVVRGGVPEGSRGFISKTTLISGGIILGGVFLTMLIFAGSSSAGTTQISSPKHLPVTQFAVDIQKPGVTILDVRTPEEYATGHIKGAVNINFYDSNFQDEINKLDKTASYDVYCHSGNRSGQALTVMSGLGFKNIKDLSGGMTAWLSNGLPVGY